MLQWITKRKWLPEIIFTLILSSLAFIVDWQISGVVAGLLGAFIAASVFFFRKWTYLAPVVFGLGVLAEIPLGLPPIAASAIVPLVVGLLAIFAPRKISLIAAGVAGVAGVTVMAYTAFTIPYFTQLYGIVVVSYPGRWLIFLLRALTVLGVTAAVWFLGSYIADRGQLRGVSRELDAVVAIQTRSQLDIADQNERFRIARDLNDLLLQQVSGILSVTDGAKYASKLDASVATRTLDRLADLMRGLHSEMRRLYDMLNGSLRVAAAPPGIADLDAFAVTIRELGYNITVKHLGEPVRLLPSAELNIYRIVFEAVENVRAHAPIGSDIDVLFTWNEQGLQVLVKDNGIEVTNRMLSQNGKPVEVGYSVEDDQDALTQAVDGPTIGGMRERAALFQGSIEAKRVPGVGFTLNAIFPGIYEYASKSDG